MNRPPEYELTLALMRELHRHLEQTDDRATALVVALDALANAVASILALDHASDDLIDIFNQALSRHIHLIRRTSKWTQR